MNRIALAALGLALALAGCTGTHAPAPTASCDGATPTAACATGMTILGLVQDESFAPIAGANVALRLTNHTATTDAGGLFTFTGLVLSPYVVDVLAAGYANATLTAEPRQNVSLTFILSSPTQAIPDPVVLHFAGKFDCALEALIISPSCDSATDEAGLSIFEDISTFDFGLNPGWATVVVDVDFEEHQGIDGLRVTVQGKSDADKVAAYEQYGRFHGSDPFTFRIEPNQAYADGTSPVPANATSLQLEVYPQGHGWHAGGVSPFLGVGAAPSVQFDVYVTIFYVQPAPADYTLLA